ncbi:hypothetical protein RHGRI_031299 [Rhododendron griersonianum]|uniref:Uncharacterized protein n=1 Tax=Rhododendron griersonianum TaxID=479676 RepID=A0AAV6I7P9_9ERIC|nr:hypothetical protein RHGRI_031299 [Rhododendron griersonianum]
MITFPSLTTVVPPLHKPIVLLHRVFSIASFYTSFKDGTVVPICLPQPVMERFEEELKKMTEEPSHVSFDNRDHIHALN